MYKRYSSYRGYGSRRRRGKTSDGGGWIRFCVFGTLIGIALMCNVFFREQIQTLSERVAGDWASADYSSAFAAVGRAVKGSENPAAAWSEVKSSLSGNSVTTNAAVGSGSGAAAYELLKSGLPFPAALIPVEPDDDGVSADADTGEETMVFDYSAIPAAATDSGTAAVTAYDDGIVIANGESPLYGNYLIILHGDITAQYFHCPELKVR
ncbi:MAG: M23 family metallopeptidase, partial [Oscillospiraceae bacterium]|nr:M23 family metallopeptidase [Oscillospiraceae bacterium]